MKEGFQDERGPQRVMDKPPAPMNDCRCGWQTSAKLSKMEKKRTELGLWKKGSRGDSVGQGCAWRSLNRFSVRVEGRTALWEDLRVRKKGGDHRLHCQVEWCSDSSPVTFCGTFGMLVSPPGTPFPHTPHRSILKKRGSADQWAQHNDTARLG